MSFHCLLWSSFSDDEPAKLLIFVPCLPWVKVLCGFQDLAASGFRRFDHDVSKAALFVFITLKVCWAPSIARLIFFISFVPYFFNFSPLCSPFSPFGTIITQLICLALLPVYFLVGWFLLFLFKFTNSFSCHLKSSIEQSSKPFIMIIILFNSGIAF